MMESDREPDPLDKFFRRPPREPSRAPDAVAGLKQLAERLGQLLPHLRRESAAAEARNRARAAEPPGKSLAEEIDNLRAIIADGEADLRTLGPEERASNPRTALEAAKLAASLEGCMLALERALELQAAIRELAKQTQFPELGALARAVCDGRG